MKMLVVCIEKYVICMIVNAISYKSFSCMIRHSTTSLTWTKHTKSWDVAVPALEFLQFLNNFSSHFCRFHRFTPYSIPSKGIK